MLSDSGSKDKDEEEMLNDISGKGNGQDPTDSIDREMEDKPEKKAKVQEKKAEKSEKKTKESENKKEKKAIKLDKKPKLSDKKTDKKA